MPLDNIQFDIVEPNYKIKMTSKPNSKSDNRTFIIIAIIRIKVVYDILDLMLFHVYTDNIMKEVFMKVTRNCV